MTAADESAESRCDDGEAGELPPPPYEAQLLLRVLELELSSYLPALPAEEAARITALQQEIAVHLYSQYGDYIVEGE